MRRAGFNISLLILPALVLGGSVCLAVGIPGGNTALALLGGGLVVAALCVLPFLLLTRVRTRRLLARGSDLPGVHFVASRIDPSRGKERQFEPLSLIAVDETGFRSLRGAPLAERWRIPWSEVRAIEPGSVAHGSSEVHTVDIVDASGRRRLRVADESGWSASPAYVSALISEVDAIRQAGASQSPPSGGSVSSTDAGRPPQGSEAAVTEP